MDSFAGVGGIGCCALKATRKEPMGAIIARSNGFQESQCQVPGYPNEAVNCFATKFPKTTLSGN